MQVTATTDALDDRPPSYVLVNGMFVPFASMQLSLCGVKAEEHSTKVKVKQSDKDRKTTNTKPVEWVELFWALTIGFFALILCHFYLGFKSKAQECIELLQWCKNKENQI